MSTVPPEEVENASGRDDSSHLVAAIAQWYQSNARALPWRENGFGAWGILVSEFMLQQTPVARVIEPLRLWMERWPTPSALASEPAGEAVRAWGRLGYPRRALRLHACAVAITDHHDGQVPEDVDELLSLPGVGEYTARAVAVFAYGHRHPVVDTNVRRVLARAIDGNEHPAPPSTRRDLAAMEAVLPTDIAEARVVSAAVMELGAIVCTARTPSCAACPIADRCAWRAAGYPDHVGPIRKPQAKYEGSDRQVRGLILAQLRSSEVPVSAEDLRGLWHDDAQRDRALAGLRTDGLIEAISGETPESYRLPE